jgi:hypothetical protein
MPGKMARSDPRLSVRVTRGAGSGHTSRLSCKRAGKTRILMPVWDSSGESRLRLRYPECGTHAYAVRRFVGDPPSIEIVGIAPLMERIVIGTATLLTFRCGGGG